MPTSPRTIFRSRSLILTWVILWVTTIPLFHTHFPDLSGDTAATQGGIAHTVFSADLPGEFSRFSPAVHRDHFSQVSNRVSNSPELDFVLSSEDSKGRKMGEPSALSMFGSLPGNSFLHSISEPLAIHRRTLVLQTSLGARAPPSVPSFFS